MRQSAIGGWFGFSTTGGLFLKDAASKHRVGAGTCDANEGSRIEGVNVVNSPGVVILPSVANIPYPSDTATRDEVSEKIFCFVSSDAVTAIELGEPAWRV